MQPTDMNIRAPWDDETVAALNNYQDLQSFHPYTCLHRGDGHHEELWNHDRGTLVATSLGWICPDCDYTQTWANLASVNLGRQLRETS